jgi:hypothetical protein
MPSAAEATVMAQLDFPVPLPTVKRLLSAARGNVRTAARSIYYMKMREEEEEDRNQWLAAQRRQHEVYIRTRAHCGTRGRTRHCASSLPWRACSQQSVVWILQASRDVRPLPEMREEERARWARRRM